MSKEEALIYQKALIASLKRQIKLLTEEARLAGEEIGYLKQALNKQRTTPQTPEEVEAKAKRLAGIRKRNILKKQRKELRHF